MKRLCIVCHERPAEIPDRDAYPDRRKRVCRGCHADRLRGDLEGIAQAFARRERLRGEGKAP